MTALLLAALLAQYQVAGVNAPVPLDADADAMTDALHLGKPAQREYLLRRLGVPPPVAHDAPFIEQQSGPRVETLGSAWLLWLPCGSISRTAHLYLLQQQNGTWHTADDAALDCWWKPSSYELVRVPGRAAILVLVHHANASHGTGLVRDEMKLLEARGSRWAAILTTTEYLSEDVTGEDLTVEQAGTLQPFPDGSVEETRATTRHEGSSEQWKLKIERRRWRWSAAKGCFTAGRFARAL